jgi:peptide/nickel transport system permease protein
VTRYLLSRVLSALVVLLLLSMMVFAMVRLIPGDPVAAFVDPSNPDPAVIARLRAELGLDQPWPTQYLSWLGNVLTGDFGRAITQPADVSTLLLDRLPVSLELSIMATVLGVAIGIPAGTVAAIHAGRAGDAGVRALSFAFLATPPFVLGTVLVLVNSVTLRLPLIGYVAPSEDLLGNVAVMFLPALVLGLVLAALVARYTRGALLDTFAHDFLRTARAKGADSARLVRGHALRNALIPVTTVVGIELGTLVGGTVVTEAVFALPGMGSALISAVRASDYPVIQGAVLLIGAVYVVINLAVDLIYPLIDPRVRVSHG